MLFERFERQVSEYVVLVDEEDRVVGTEEKLRAHLTSARHRAVSVVLCSRDGRLLLQQRSAVKYHSPGLWSNTCCGHPRPGEPAADAARRRLAEEMGGACALLPASRLTYCVDVGGGLIEHELNHVFVGEFDGVPHPNTQEVAQWTWADSNRLRPVPAPRRAADTVVRTCRLASASVGDDRSDTARGHSRRGSPLGLDDDPGTDVLWLHDR